MDQDQLKPVRKKSGGKGGSVGGWSIAHQKMPGIKALMGAPKPYRASPPEPTEPDVVQVQGPVRIVRRVRTPEQLADLLVRLQARKRAAKEESRIAKTQQRLAAVVLAQKEAARRKAERRERHMAQVAAHRGKPDAPIRIITLREYEENGYPDFGVEWDKVMRAG